MTRPWVGWVVRGKEDLDWVNKGRESWLFNEGGTGGSGVEEGSRRPTTGGPEGDAGRWAAGAGWAI